MIPASAWKPTWATLALAALLLWAPLPFASITPAALLALRIGLFATLVVAAFTEPRPFGGGVAVPAAALLLIALIGLLQSVPLPRELVERVSPERPRLEAVVAEEVPAKMPLSLAPAQSASTALTFAAVCAALTLGAAVGGRRRGRRWVLAAVLAAALFQLLYGFRRLAAGSNEVWGLEVGRASDRLRGTFVNPAHLAPYLEIALAVAFGLCWWAAVRLAGGRRPLEARLALAALPALLWLLIFAGIAFTRSRAGLAAAVLATLAQGVLLAAHHRRWRLLPVGVLAAAAGVALVAWTGLEQGLGRLLGTSAQGVAANARIEVWRGTAELWRRFPLTGTGLGSFEATFPMVEDSRLATVSWQHAHNDWLELLSTGGVVALLAALVGIGALAWRLRCILARPASAEAAAAALAGLGVLVAVGFHELLDFGLTLPANAVTAAAVLGVAAAGDGDAADGPAPPRLQQRR